ncbi:hypothetical protein LEP1GSC185_3616 [Leptospira licerasiae serovar Varillal str. VAR 010]|uniref:Uncharacterized protein n=1 Tax=Leptospira licerasiae str. MMD4847 TaxID=1049971 RepID=A0ABN0HEJ5_9LEPT|nr:hypothetical protein LEP1GSC185_3616 [Leptospira licerasiae serovar Varillal str. VAR 010]EJZ43970.1 hypothetical protein LEP1GSC178_2278 [Leptospira licerasiae str. MMD4847]
MIRKNSLSKIGKICRTSLNFRAYRIRPGLNRNSFRRIFVFGLFCTNVCKKEKSLLF